jgi:hypothetical protein
MRLAVVTPTNGEESIPTRAPAATSAGCRHIKRPRSKPQGGVVRVL